MSESRFNVQRYEFLISFPITIGKPDILNWESLNWEFVFPSPVTMVKSSKLFSCDSDHYDMMKCRQNVNFEKMDTEPSRRKNDGFWLLWVIFKQYLKQNIITAVLKKANSHSVVICRLIKKINNIIEDPRRKTNSNFDFSQAA